MSKHNVHAENPGFVIGGTEYTCNKSGTYFFKIVDERKLRISKNEYETAFEAYTDNVADKEV